MQKEEAETGVYIIFYLKNGKLENKSMRSELKDDFKKKFGGIKSFEDYDGDEIEQWLENNK
jgi:hypothetical protein